MLTYFDRYVMRTIFLTSSLAGAFLLTADFIIQTSADIDELGKGGFTVTILLLKHLLTLPEKFTLFAPAAVLIGAIMGLGQLNAQQEITIIQAAGISRIRLARGAMLFAVVVGCLSLANSEYFVPKLRDKSELITNQALGRSSHLSQKEGIWLQQGGEIIHIARLNLDGSLQEIQFFHFSGENTEIMTAERAHYAAPDWQLDNPRRFRINPQGFTVMPTTMQWKNAPPPETLQQLANSHHADTIKELYILTRFMAANGLNHQSESLRLWQKLLTPVTILTMVLLALPFAFGNARSGQQGTRLVIGIFLGVAYYVINGVVANLALLLNWPSFLGAILPVVLFTLLPLWLLIRR